MEKGLRIRGLIETDLGFAGRVREIAGWNQLPADWRRFLALEPDGCFLAEVDGQAAGTATTTVYGSDLAWIGMVLVHPDFRRRGVGTALLGHAIHYLREIRRIPSVKLDATPEGLPLYEKLGFQAEWGLRRWLSKPGAHRTGGERVLSSFPLSPMSAELDREVFGADRLALLRSLEDGALGRESWDDGSFGLMRDGARAVYLGPITARSTIAGEEITKKLISRVPADRPIFWDIPDDHASAVAVAESLDFEPVRELTRMWLGANATPGDPSRMWAIADPALG